VPVDTLFFSHAGQKQKKKRETILLAQYLELEVNQKKAESKKNTWYASFMRYLNGVTVNGKPGGARLTETIGVIWGVALFVPLPSSLAQTVGYLL
jgi:hypothetical protein